MDTGRWSPDIKSQIYATQMLKPHGSYKFFGLLGCRTSFETTHVNGLSGKDGRSGNHQREK